MSGTVDVLAVMDDVASNILIPNGGAYADEMREARAAVAELITACEIAVQTLIVSCQPAGNPDVDDAEEIRSAVYTLRDSLSRVQGGAP